MSTEKLISLFFIIQTSWKKYKCFFHHTLFVSHACFANFNIESGETDKKKPYDKIWIYNK